ncbi:MULTISPECIES: Bax inhibitor-1/YccA family membrane protein [Streptomyces]|uniref:Bax inhibitor-1/YccA family protein n=1 Tax=Streptomyces flaveolus TaxID=67297 RepID=A0ABV3ANR6_9ACTN|nr:MULTISPECIES: Bax inhibitor-1/YccA family protein [Streptomyces]KMS92639.1 membrane protein [Streptomyces regensis]KOG60192.1 membrane protein [Streptomyces antibioticus]MBG7700336.1 Bax inhibitor-1/YccA family protein [Streptomyces sp. MC1]
MKSSNPIFSRWGAARDAAPADAYMRHPVGAPAGARPSDDYLTNPYAPAAGTGPDTGVRTTGTAVTMDDVVVRTATTLGTVVLTAVLSWLLLPVDEANIGRSYGIAVGAALIAFVLSMVQAFKRAPSPALILGYAAFEGVFLGVISSTTSTYIAPGVVVQAVLGTFAVSAGVLIAYRMRWIRVDQRFAGFLAAAATGFFLLLVADLLFSAFGAGDGLGFHSGGLGIVFGVIGILLGAGFLALDFRQVEDAVAYGAPREEAWLAAFGLTTTLVWIYLEVLQVLSIFNSDN